MNNQLLNAFIKKLLSPFKKHEYVWAGSTGVNKVLNEAYSIYNCKECDKQILARFGEIPEARQYGCLGKKEVNQL
ncbi:hypothetical protein BSK59_14055 [Paenibacillus odorifer]|uniref:hypothetical protein n=1 Tax=Paenibacillus odorifer TaxID=189426 RepID=UPI0009701DBD|nr:hypothetical protein [Paenibacillus odorifer]OME55592.1 hypothetical protein BSK59_14055 [Paenibacillus odorifer]